MLDQEKFEQPVSGEAREEEADAPCERCDAEEKEPAQLIQILEPATPIEEPREPRSALKEAAEPAVPAEEDAIPAARSEQRETAAPVYTAVLTSAPPLPYYGTPLSVGSQGPDVALMQTQLNGLRTLYPDLALLTVDGKYGTKTRDNVGRYQLHKGLTADGVIGNTTWNSIVSTYNSVYPGKNVYPGITMSEGSSGSVIVDMETLLNRIAKVYTAINTETVDGKFGSNMYNAVVRFQRQFGLSSDGVIGPNTWNKIVSVDGTLQAGGFVAVTTPYPGTPQQEGSEGNNVRYIQSYMGSITGLPTVTIDGIFGSQTKNLVMQFQLKYGLSVDGIVGPNTWSRMIIAFNARD